MLVFSMEGNGIMDLYEILKHLQIAYEEVDHSAIFSVSEAQIVKEKISGVGCKSLFLTDCKGTYIIYLLKDSKHANISLLKDIFKVSHLSFASEEELFEILHLKRGSVSPLGIIFDKENKVIIAIDSNLKMERLLVHPNVNTKTIALSFDDLFRFIIYTGHSYVFVDDDL